MLAEGRESGKGISEGSDPTCPGYLLVYGKEEELCRCQAGGERESWLLCARSIKRIKRWHGREIENAKGTRLKILPDAN